MVDGLIGIKVGMTQVFDENGTVVPVTVIKAGPCVVVQRKAKDPDGYGLCFQWPADAREEQG